MPVGAPADDVPGGQLHQQQPKAVHIRCQRAALSEQQLGGCGQEGQAWADKLMRALGRSPCVAALAGPTGWPLAQVPAMPEPPAHLHAARSRQQRCEQRPLPAAGPAQDPPGARGSRPTAARCCISTTRRADGRISSVGMAWWEARQAPSQQTGCLMRSRQAAGAPPCADVGVHHTHPLMHCGSGGSEGRQARAAVGCLRGIKECSVRLACNQPRQPHWACAPHSR